MVESPHFRFEPGRAKTLVVAFTSYGADNAPAKAFEWVGCLAPFDCHKLFLRDEKQHWYLGGVQGFSSSMEETADRVGAYMREHGITRLVTLGSSMGGFGALSLGALMGADKMLGFGSNTIVDRDWCDANTDLRCWPKIHETTWMGYHGRDLMMLPAGELGSAELFYDPAYDFDARQAMRLADRGDARLTPLRGVGHFIAPRLFREGRLQKIFADALEPLEDVYRKRA